MVSSSPLSTLILFIVTVITISCGSVLDSNSSFLALASSSVSYTYFSFSTTIEEPIYSSITFPVSSRVLVSFISLLIFS